MSTEYVLIVQNSDRSGVQHAWGPYQTEQDAERAWHELYAIGVMGISVIVPMLHRIPSVQAASEKPKVLSLRTPEPTVLPGAFAHDEQVDLGGAFPVHRTQFPMNGQSHSD